MTTEALTIIGDAIRPVFEDVESRTLMSASNLDGHVLTIVGTSGDDQIDVAISDDGSQMWTKVDGHTSDAMLAQSIYEIRIDAGGGDNVIHVDSRIAANAYVTTGSGHDVVHTGRGNDVINTGGGNDVIDSGAGNDKVNAGSGNDKVNGGSGDDYLDGGSGKDSISADGGADKIFGRKGDDKLYGDADDSLDGEGGRNQISKSTSMKIRSDGFVAPKIVSLSIVDADTGETVRGYESLTADTTLDATKLPARYTVIANAEQGVESVYFQTADGKLFHRDNGKEFSLTSQAANGSYTAWQPTAGKTYALNVVANAADDLRGFAGETFSIKLTLKSAAPHGGTGSTGTTGTTGTDTTGASFDAPVIKVEAIDDAAIVGQAFALDATATTIPGHDVEDAHFEWNFGDPAGKHNALPGFNAAHVYDRPGTYTATLTVTGPGGTVSRYSRTVTVAARAMRTIYVAANGNDASEGGSQDRPVRTLGRAAQLITDDTRVVLRRGDTFGVAAGIGVENDNVVIATYGVGASPIVRYEGARVMTPMIRVEGSAKRVAIEGLTFDSIFNTDTNEENMPEAIQLGGTLCSVRGNTFLNVRNGVNGNGNPTGVYIADNTAPSTTGIRGYFCWIEGTQYTIVDNTVVNTTREHVVRVGNATKVTIDYNDFTNLDRRAVDPTDYRKSAINDQRGAYTYVAYNKANGVISVGPLESAAGFAAKDARMKHAVVEGNVVTNADIIVQHGAEYVTIRDNVVYAVDGGTAIYVTGFNALFNRGSSDVVIEHNLAVNLSTGGRFVEVGGAVDGITLTNNTFVAPHLQAGAYGNAAIYDHESTLASFTEIGGNIWPTLDDGKAAYTGRIAIVGDQNDPESYLDAATWNAMPKVGTDHTADSNAAATLSIVAARLMEAA